MSIIHETIVRDIVDIAKGIKDSDEIEKLFGLRNGQSWSSIARRSEQLVLVFPVIVSKNISYESAMRCSKAIERDAVIMLMMLFASVNITNVQTIPDYIAKFHTNLDLGKMNVDQFLSVIDSMEENSFLEVTNRSQYEKVKDDLRNINTYFKENVNETRIKDFEVKKYGSTYVGIDEARSDRRNFNNSGYNISPGTRITGGRVTAPRTKYDVGSITYNSGTTSISYEGEPSWELLDRVQTDLENERKIFIGLKNSKADKSELDMQNNKINELERIGSSISADLKYIGSVRSKSNNSINNNTPPSGPLIDKQHYSNINTRYQINNNILTNTEIKKANEMVPTLMNVNFSYMPQDSSYPVTVVGLVGVKAKLYVVDSYDIIDRLKLKNQNKNAMLNLIKVSTREISFFKDFLFAIDQAKLDALSQSRRGSSHKIWKVLERRGIKSKIRRGMFMNNDASAITSLVISQEEVEYIKKTEYFDLEDPKTIRPIMDAYNLMEFLIVDESLQITKIIKDTGDDTYEYVTFDNLEREQKDNTKKIVNLMSKVAR